jgi:hypothetical protein
VTLRGTSYEQRERGRDVHMSNIAILFLIKNILVGKNVKLSQLLLEHHAMKTYGGLEISLHPYSSTLYGGE